MFLEGAGLISLHRKKGLALYVAPITERLVMGSPTPAERGPVPYRGGFAIGRNQRDTPAYPEWPVFALCRIFDDHI